jgi:sugar lactone lactonase YvrE
MKKLALLLGVACVVLAAFAGGGTASPVVGAPAPVMTGLHNPRGLAIDNRGSLYVAEAGQGGSAPCAVFSDGMTKCYGPTGRISRLKNGIQEVVADGLPSNAPAGGNAATGPHNIAVEGGHLFVTDGLGANPLEPTIQPFRALGQGWLYKVHPGSHWDPVLDVSAFEAAHNPVGPPDSNPYGLINTGGHRVLTDAGGNDLLEAHGNHLELLATFPSRPERDTDSVPTTVAQGPDGSYYVGELSGAPFNAGAANVYRVSGGQATVYCSGFTAIISIAFGPDGHLYVLQFATEPGLNGPGVLYRIDSGCTKTPVVTDLFTPGGLAFGRDGAAYISQGSILASDGTVWRFELGT